MRTDFNLLEAALIGYQHQRELLAVKIADIQRQLGGAPATSSGEAPKKRVMNAAARKRIAQAQRKRWAEFHKTRGVTPKKKRMMSAEGRERIAEATRKRWAEFQKTSGTPTKKAPTKAKRQMSAAGWNSGGESSGGEVSCPPVDIAWGLSEARSPLESGLARRFFNT